MDVSRVVIDGLEQIEIPPLIPIRQRIQKKAVQEVFPLVEKEVEKTCLKNRIKKGSLVAIAVGSRKIHRLDEVVAAIISIIKKYGGRPFIVPAMGSHGGAMAPGQVEILKEYGITEESMGAPIEASMEVITLGKSENGIPLFFDRLASQADAVIPVNRIKVHTDYEGELESGLLKMLCIGLGKHRGATTIHGYGFDNFHWVIPEAGRAILERSSVIMGIALLEDGEDKLCTIKALAPDVLEEEEKNLLNEQKEILPRIPFPTVDLLIVDEMGKDVSGSGMDGNVVGRIKPVPTEIGLIVVLDLTPGSHGNATGMGLADLAPRKFFDKIDFSDTYTNLITSRVIGNGRLPMILEDAVTTIKTALFLIDKDPDTIKIVRIKNTLEIENMHISRGLLPEAKENQKIEITGEPGIASF